MDYNNLEHRFEREYKAYKESIKRPNILLLGATGAGKSSLINTIFGEAIAPSGAGRPVTDGIFCYDDKSLDIVLYDSRGYEVGEEKVSQYKEEVLSFIQKRERNPSDAIHLIWHCIAASSHRITDLDRETIEEMASQGLPLAVVFTQCDRATEEELTSLETITRAMGAKSFRVTNQKNLGYLQLHQLLSWSVDHLVDDGLKRSFISSQIRDLELKRREALQIINQHVGGSAFVSFTPIPFSDTPLLLANQMGMAARIFHVYGLEDLSNKLPFFIKKLKLGYLVSLFGKKASLYLTSQIVKLFPGLGTLGGGLINAAVASAITVAIGKTISHISYHLAHEALQGKVHNLTSYIEKNQDLWQGILQKTLKEEFKKL